MKDAAYWDWLARRLDQTAYELIAADPHGAWLAQAKDAESPDRWWSFAFEQSEGETQILDAAARAIAHGRPAPPLSTAQIGRLSLRFRMASRLARGLGRHCTIDRKGWFPTRLARMEEAELKEWLLVVGWPFCAEILDETLQWADQIPEAVRAMWQVPPATSCADSDSFAM